MDGPMRGEAAAGGRSERFDALPCPRGRRRHSLSPRGRRGDERGPKSRNRPKIQQVGQNWSGQSGCGGGRTGKRAHLLAVLPRPLWAPLSHTAALSVESS